MITHATRTRPAALRPNGKTLSWSCAAGLLALCLLLSGCMTPSQSAHFPDQSKAIETPGKARLYVLFPYTTSMTTFTLYVWENGQSMGQNAANRYLCWETTPGQTLIASKVSNNAFSSKAELRLSLEPNHVYYIEQQIKPMGMFNPLSLRLLSDAEGRKVLETCTPPAE